MRKQDGDAVLSLRLPADEAERLTREAEARGTTVSRVARQALAAGLRPLPAAPLSYGLVGQPSDMTLSVSTYGPSMPEARTTGGLVVLINKA